MVFVSSRVAVLLAAVAFPILCQPALGADPKRPAAAAVKVEPTPSGSEIVGKLLKEGPSDPDVPLPQRGLGEVQAPASTPLEGPRVFGRREEGGAVMGLKIPIRVNRGTN